MNFQSSLERQLELLPQVRLVPASPPSTDRLFPLQSSSQTKISASYEHVTLRRGSSFRVASLDREVEPPSLPTIFAALAFDQ